LVRDILVPMVAQQIINKPERVEKVSLDSLEQACLSFLNNFQQKYFITFMIYFYLIRLLKLFYYF